MKYIKFEELDDNYEKVLELCKKKKRPLYATVNNKKELVIMDANTYKEILESYKTQELIMMSYIAFLKGEKNYSLNESKELINNLINKKK